MATFWTILLAIIVIAVIVIVVLAKLYRKATREVSLIRTGVGGQQVVMAGGTLALPYFHEVSEVNMRTLRLEVKRSGEDSLITRDRLRMDIGASFSIAVDGSEEAVAKAAQTLGDRTFNAEKVREIIEGKLVDALRAVAAQKTMDEAHEGRAAFVKDVRELISDDLAENGLRLQSVSLTSLDQTPFSALDENNAFNAVGMRKLAEVIATSRKNAPRSTRMPMSPSVFPPWKQPGKSWRSSRTKSRRGSPSIRRSKPFAPLRVPRSQGGVRPPKKKPSGAHRQGQGGA